jgi:hypothetical protein
MYWFIAKLRIEIALIKKLSNLTVKTRSKKLFGDLPLALELPGLVLRKGITLGLV